MFAAQEGVEIVLKSDGVSFAGKIYVNNGTYIIIAPDTEEYARFTVGAKVELIQTQAECLYKMDTSVVQCHDRGFAVRVTAARSLERRRTPRVRCETGAYFTRQETDAAEMAQAGALRDISSGGARMFSPVFLPPASVLTLEINLDGSLIGPTAEVVRCVPLKDSLMKKHSPCQFDVALRFITVRRVDQVHLHRYMIRHDKKFTDAKT